MDSYSRRYNSNYASTIQAITSITIPKTPSAARRDSFIATSSTWRHALGYQTSTEMRDGRSSLVVKIADSWLACHEFDPGTAEDPPCRGGRYTLNISKLKRPSVDVVWKLNTEEVWLYYYDPTIKQQSSESKHPSSPTLRKAKTVKSAAVLNHKILEANSQVQNVKLGGHQTCLSINRLWNELCNMLRRLVGTTAPGHHDCSIQE
ncbi:uncharacterized protein TNCV_4226161 [Trichonephila clavipes]|uniref:Uncharacterized protein n=1 Tax=Trichonephila clavipes TaxID=2585209 RepID=A0A8X6VHV6_TRICX|nr:uncharacterized protein TNCV_4226161 [Trichonephila clavipes]